MFYCFCRRSPRAHPRSAPLLLHTIPVEAHRVGAWLDAPTAGRGAALAADVAQDHADERTAARGALLGGRRRGGELPSRPIGPMDSSTQATTTTLADAGPALASRWRAALATADIGAVASAAKVKR